MVRVDAHSRCPAAECPSCGAMGVRVHNTYRRRLADRPLGGRLVVLTLRVRRPQGSAHPPASPAPAGDPEPDATRPADQAMA
ncbi:transposase family protein [Kitasatospora sp. NPDC001603]|uniref:transposase family protein n=1 Tax=Kitasatospora sp. NPDC001603 TaxID=3154388 RepID=UPI00331891B0